MTVKPIFAWYDLWIGAFWDQAKRRLYVFPVPMFGLVVQFPTPTPSQAQDGYEADSIGEVNQAPSPPEKA